MKVLKQQQINDIQNILALSGVRLNKEQVELVYNAVFDMIMIHQLHNDTVYTPIGKFTSYVRKPTTYTNPQHPEGERIASDARFIPKLIYGRTYYNKFKSLPTSELN